MAKPKTKTAISSELLPKRKKLKSHFYDNCIPEPNSGCWLWEGPVYSNMYGYVEIRDERYSAHRFSFELSNGQIPNNMFVCHACDNPICVNPEHLFLGSHNDNMLDKARKNRGKGERHPSARLTASDVLTIRSDKRSHSMISKEYGIARQTVGDIKNRRRWGHLE